MRPKFEHRKSKRFEHKATVILKDEPVGYISYGKMINYSNGGMLIGSDTPFQLGTNINITLAKSVFKPAPQTYYGTVKWCKERLITESRYHYGNYGIGLNIFRE